jgi:hypothetical protein
VVLAGAGGNDDEEKEGGTEGGKEGKEGDTETIFRIVEELPTASGTKWAFDLCAVAHKVQENDELDLGFLF